MGLPDLEKCVVRVWKVRKKSKTTENSILSEGVTNKLKP
jgi:hypothetical protein